MSPFLPRLVFRSASGTPKSLTPRQRDTDGPKPGLSAFLHVADVPGRRPTKVQVIDVDRVRIPLAVTIDGKHASIVPVLSGGGIDRRALEEWAAARDTENIHEFTQLVLDAVVAQRVLE
jgi:hypothetical protein